MKNALNGIDSRLHITKEKIIELEDIAIQTFQNQTEKNKQENH